MLHQNLFSASSNHQNLDAFPVDAIVIKSIIVLSDAGFPSEPSKKPRVGV